jgi:ribosomal protein L24E
MIGRRGKIVCDFCHEEITEELLTMGREHLKYPGKTVLEFCSEACRIDMFDHEINERVQAEVSLLIDSLPFSLREQVRRHLE